MKPKSIELRANQKLLDAQFESYKLSLVSLPSYSSELQNGLMNVPIKAECFSYEKTRCLTLHNYLSVDHWYPENVFYLDSVGAIRRFHIPLENHIEPSQVVYTFPGNVKTSDTSLPSSILFPSANLCVASDGCSSLTILNTGNRNIRSTETWSVSYTDNNMQSAMILSAVSRQGSVSTSFDYLDVLVAKFEDAADDKLPSKDSTVIMLEWLVFEKPINSEAYTLCSSKMLQGKSFPYYAAISTDCSKLYLASKNDFKFIPAWENDIDLEMKDEEEGDEECSSKPLFTWKQSNEDVTMFIDLPDGLSKNDIMCSINPKKISVSIRSQSQSSPVEIISGDLYLDADPEMCNWSLESNILEITIQKRVEGRTWMQVVEGEDHGKLLVDPKEAAEIHEKLAHLTSDTMNTEEEGHLFNSEQYEDCDSYYESLASLTCFDSSSESFTHIADISSYKWLFNCFLAPGDMQSIVLRYDVDGVIWQPSSNSQDVRWNHIATFNALGYVHASKTNLKYASCSPSTSYAALCDCQKRVYVYHQPSLLTSPLKNRNSGKIIKKISTQQVATLKNNDDILGFATCNDRIYILTASELTVLKVTL